MIKNVSQIKEELADREAIRDVLLRYCRASDRCDAELMRSVYWPDAHDDHLEFSGNTEEFIAYSMPILRSMRYNMHILGNILISIDDGRADAESYFQGYHSVDDGGRRHDVFAAGRYLDNLERRGEEWRIIKRFVTVEWFRELPDSADWERGPFGMQVYRGTLKPDDKSYDLLKLMNRVVGAT
jgi:hypothetical protein